MKVGTHVPHVLFLEDHDHRKRIGVGTMENDMRVEKSLNFFIKFILLGKGMKILVALGRRLPKTRGME